jgi:hypothetical protein
MAIRISTKVNKNSLIQEEHILKIFIYNAHNSRNRAEIGDINKRKEVGRYVLKVS